MARKRSWRDLQKIKDYANQRILSGRGGVLSASAAGKAVEYADNIKYSKSGRQNAQRYKEYVAKYGVKKAREMSEKYLTRKYSANTYMGLNGG